LTELQSNVHALLRFRNHGKNEGFDFFPGSLRCAHKSGDVINFIIVACKISSRLKFYKYYKNGLRLAKVIIKNKMSRFYGSLYTTKNTEIIESRICWCFYCETSLHSFNLSM